ncbi:MAG: hypothetical protein L3J67_09100 [Hyphomicrobiaceae bacterium]|nr:hypothetical protein [Hyphomicrobiaceae bacterium]
MKLQSTAQNTSFTKLAHEGANHYERLRHLPALLALWPSEIEDFGKAGTKDIIDRLERALASERRRGRARHWCYDINRHMALANALKAERIFLRGLKPYPKDKHKV